VVGKAVVIAYGVHETGRREILGVDVGAAETEAFWTDFVRSLVARGLRGVQLVVSDAHEGLKQAIARILSCPWQRCTVHFLRDCLGHARRDQHGLLAALIRPVFQADSAGQARDRLSEAVAHLDGKLPKGAALLEQAEQDILAFYSFPPAHWPKLRSTNPLERFNKGDRPPHRRRRHLPRRPLADPARRHALPRAKRRVARRPPLPVRRRSLRTSPSGDSPRATPIRRALCSLATRPTAPSPKASGTAGPRAYSEPPSSLWDCRTHAHTTCGTRSSRSSSARASRSSRSRGRPATRRRRAYATTATSSTNSTPPIGSRRRP
jgi:Transposase, Mutator family